MALGAQHDQAGLVLLGGFDDPLPSRGCLDGRSLRPEPGLAASDAPCSAVSSAAFVLGGLVRVEMALATGMNPTSTGCHTTAPGRLAPFPAV